MKKSMRKDFFREIKNSFNRFLSIMLIVALGVAFFSGIRATSPDMKLSADIYYDRENMMDLRVLGTWGVTDEDIEGLKQIEGIKEIEPLYSYDVMGKVTGNQYVLKAYSAPDNINKMKVVEGRLPEKEGECAIDEQLVMTGEFQIGDTLTIQSGNEEELSDVIKGDQYEIVGVVNSRIYMDVERGSTTIGNGKINGYFVLPKEEFTLEAYTEVVMTVEGAKELLAYSKEYEEYVAPVKARVEDFIEQRAELRYDDTIKEAKEKIADGEKEVKDGERELKDGQKELNESKKQVEDAEKELANGEIELASGEEEFTSAEQKVIDGEAELEKGKQELSEKKAELLAKKEQLEQAEKEIQDGKAQIKEGKEQLAKGEQELVVQQETIEQGKKAYEEQESSVKTALQEAKTELKNAKKTLDANKKQYEETEKATLQPIEEAKTQLEKTKQQLDQWKAQIAKLEQEVSEDDEQLVKLKQQYQASLAEYEAAKQEIEAKESLVKEQLAEGKKALEEAEEQYNQGLSEYNEKKSKAEKELQSAKKQLEQGEKQIETAKTSLASSKKELVKKEKELTQAEKEIEQSKPQLAEGESALKQAEQTILASQTQLEEGRQELEKNRQKLLDARRELEEGWQQLEDGKKKITDGEKELADGKKELAKAKEKLADAKDELADLDEPEYYVLDRDSIVSAVSFGNDAERIKAIGEVFPAIFFLVAALVSLTTMTRMVESDRTQIGTLKALGYSKWNIAMRYILYALFATLVGSLIGMILGQKIFPNIIIGAYKMMYQTLPDVVVPLNSFYSITSCFLAIATILVATIFACYKELQEVPAGLMRPVAPKVGKRVLLERIPCIWNRLSFISKVTVRNLFRYKKRFFMTIFGIGGCMALIIVGFGVRDSIYSIVDKQYGGIMDYDLSISIKEGKKPEKIIAGEERILGSLNTWQASIDVGTKEEDTLEAYMIVPEEKDKLEEYIHLHNRRTKETYELSSNGVIISEKLATLLNVDIGDTIIIQQEEKKDQTVLIEGIAENYLYHYVYMAPELYESLYGEQEDWNQILVKTKEHSSKEQNELSEQILKKSGVNSVTKVTESKNSIDRMMNSMDIVVVVLVISAGALAFIVLYNLNNINISERKRELATIKVLGFYDMETAEYVYRENVLLTIFGVLLGLGLGVILHHYVIITAELDMMMLGRDIKPMSFVYGALLTGIFSMFVNFVLYYKLKKIDMVESLKSVE